VTTKPATGCLLCGSESSCCSTYDGYDLYACGAPDCGHRFIHPVPTDEELMTVYDTDDSSLANADGWTMAEDYRRAPDVVRRHYEKRLQWFRENGGLEPHHAILDVGCSTAMMLRTLKDQGFKDLWGMDLSPRACAYVEREHGIPCKPSIAELPDGMFDLIVCWAVIEHTQDPVAFVRALRAKLKPGGRLAIIMPNYQSFYRRLTGKAWIWLVPPIHLQYFGWKSMGRLLTLTGLDEVSRTTTYTGTYVYLLVYHLTKMLGREMPSTTRTGRAGFMTYAVGATEAVLSLLLLPGRLLAKVLNEGSEHRCIPRRP